MAKKTTAAYELLRRLGAHPVDYIFANGGTDFAPAIEAWVEASGDGVAIPEFITVVHETVAVGMAHGYTLATGRPQAVMVHVNVGLANSVMGLLNAAADQVPMLMMSGRTPVTEYGRSGSRNVPIHWGQEMRDQGAMVREAVKWDYELKYPDQTADIAERALAIAMSEPRGPVYLSLPREVLAETVPATAATRKAVAYRPARTAPSSDAVAEAAAILMAAERPLVVSQRGAESALETLPLDDFLARHAIPLTDFWPTRNALATDHAMHAGFDRMDMVGEADAILVLDALVPWIPVWGEPAPEAKVIQAGADPLQSARPVRQFASDVSLAGSLAEVVAALDGAMEKAPRGYKGKVAARRKQVSARIREERKARRAAASDGSGNPMSKGWVSHCLSQAIDGETLLFTELGANHSMLESVPAGRLFNHPLSGGLGWAVPAALGAKMADRERLVVAMVGDGSHVFANPVACHQVAQAYDLPILILVANNAGWEAVRRSTTAMYPKGKAARANRMPVTRFDPAPDHAAVMRAAGGWAERVEDGADLPAALARAIEVVRVEKRQALLDINILFDA
ncbi:MAG: thiamine pyrophosphate-requiring protein [Rhodospirillaceae bacterium]|nr:thiamine pyrophosphate-requiring protein [Rhodospirillaceae bacterium]